MSRHNLRWLLHLSPPPPPNNPKNARVLSLGPSLHFTLPLYIGTFRVDVVSVTRVGSSYNKPELVSYIEAMLQFVSPIK